MYSELFTVSLSKPKMIKGLNFENFRTHTFFIISELTLPVTVYIECSCLLFCDKILQKYLNLLILCKHYRILAFDICFIMIAYLKTIAALRTRHICLNCLSLSSIFHQV